MSPGLYLAHYSTVVTESKVQLKCDDTQEIKWWGNWRMEWVVTTLHSISEHGVSNITTADALALAASSQLN